MVLESLIDLIATNLGFDFVSLVMLVTIVGSLIFMAKDVRVGLLILFSFFALEFIWFDSVGGDTFKITLALFATVGLMALSLFISYKQTSQAVY